MYSEIKISEFSDSEDLVRDEGYWSPLGLSAPERHLVTLTSKPSCVGQQCQSLHHHAATNRTQEEKQSGRGWCKQTGLITDTSSSKARQRKTEERRVAVCNSEHRHELMATEQHASRGRAKVRNLFKYRAASYLRVVETRKQ